METNTYTTMTQKEKPNIYAHLKSVIWVQDLFGAYIVGYYIERLGNLYLAIGHDLSKCKFVALRRDPFQRPHWWIENIDKNDTANFTWTLLNEVVQSVSLIKRKSTKRESSYLKMSYQHSTFDSYGRNSELLDYSDYQQLAGPYKNRFEYAWLLEIIIKTNGCVMRLGHDDGWSKDTLAVVNKV